jgi:hypothetical protein
MTPEREAKLWAMLEKYPVAHLVGNDEEGYDVEISDGNTHDIMHPESFVDMYDEIHRVRHEN